MRVRVAGRAQQGLRHRRRQPGGVSVGGPSDELLLPLAVLQLGDLDGVLGGELASLLLEIGWQAQDADLLLAPC